MDQLSFGMPFGKTREQALSTLRLFGDEVIPAFDTDPVHRSHPPPPRRVPPDVEGVAAAPARGALVLPDARRAGRRGHHEPQG